MAFSPSISLTSSTFYFDHSNTMSPLNFPPKKELMMNGHRPSPLKINKDSHFIQKPSVHQPKQQHQQRQGPVIIYTHSPKIIHTQARDFMALVQKLTGLSRSDHEITPVAPSSGPVPRKNNNKINNNRQEDHNESSSAITDDQSQTVGVGDVNNVCSSSTTVSAMNPFFGDMPLFTPSSIDFFCSPRPVNKFGDMGTLNSPSLLEFMKGLPDY